MRRASRRATPRASSSPTGRATWPRSSRACSTRSAPAWCRPAPPRGRRRHGGAAPPRPSDPARRRAAVPGGPGSRPGGPRRRRAERRRRPARRRHGAGHLMPHVRLVAVLLAALILAPAAFAAEWGLIQPGVSTTQTVRERYGAPSRTDRKKVEQYDTETWIYEGDRAPAGLLRLTIDFGLLRDNKYRP